ncbi:PH, RCC1 and FYVE domains-containing protein 1-like isoform X2 [Punica granatum]|uniref:PH, RCC1 and FYVE domains-containing protein 1-like isoform X2 n=1 Tax=Punica granatum TaxID=22663 RepID=A0A6P8C5U1_PUNGR|nr:PH, RCC1 and FYVE domains-containing protein 1-like isoform X2 [Punica granatum]
MADPVSYGNSERNIEQALITLKKGTQLIKYSRKGKPKFCPFRLSPDETTLIWLSHGEERTLKLSSVSRIIPGQRTAVFRRYLRPEKDYLSFSLLYNNGDRSLDLICKDKVEAEVWLAGLKALILPGQHRNRRTRSDIFDLHDGGEFLPNGRPLDPSLEFTSSIARGRVSVDCPRESSVSLGSSDVGSERANMQLRTSTGGDGFRISVSSTPSCSSGGSGQDDIESLGDVYVWGEIWYDVVLPDGTSSPDSAPRKADMIIPKALESDVVLDVHQIACGSRHVALVTRQGEVFTWGEESGGRLGHGYDRDFCRPNLVEFLAVSNIDFVACGECHTCAVSTMGDLFTWGDGTYNAGLLGHGTDVSHWVPKRVSGTLEGIQVLSIACGTWHTALSSSNGKLYTFGDGTFGVLGHGDRLSVAYPREVKSLCGLKTIKVACGVWHTAAIVEVMNQTGGNVSSRKLFTWGDGDKYRLGHGNKDTYLTPTCVPSLIDYNFNQLACGHTMTLALTTSGHIFTMGSAANGQLGNPAADGKLPCLVQDKLAGEFVEDISCGAFHVAVLTSRSEVYTWGKGANGRLGHGDVEDRKVPTLVEALKDRHVKSISCGENFTASICIHKWVSGADQSVCTACRQAFGFTRKRHNCYNCGLVYCHACSSKKALKAALAPTPGKPHRVCDACFAKLKAAEAGNYSGMNRRVTVPRQSIDARERISRGEVKSSRTLLSPTMEPVKYIEVKSGKAGNKSDSLSMIRASQVPSLLQLKDIAFPSSLSALQNALKPVNTTPSQSAPNSRSPSPYSGGPSPPRSVTPVFSRGLIDSLSKTNEYMNQEILKLQNQVKYFRQKCDIQDAEIKKLNKNAKEASSAAPKESSVPTAVKGLVHSIITQLKETAEKLPAVGEEKETFNSLRAQLESILNSAGAASYSSFPSSQEVDQHGSPQSTVSTEDHHADAISRTGSQENISLSSPSIQEGASQHHSGSRHKHVSSSSSNGVTQVIEQFEPGVYITLDLLPNGIKTFHRVKFSKRRFAEQQAEEWWEKNKDRVFKKYPPLKAVQPPTTPKTPAGESTEMSEHLSENMMVATLPLPVRTSD